MRSLWLACSLALVALLSTGCFSYTTLHTATPTPKGETEVNIAPGVFSVPGGDTTNQNDTGTQYLTVPTAEVAVRHGFSEHIDAGAKVYPIGFAFDLNYAVVNETNFAFAINPYVSVTYFGTAGADDDTTNDTADDASLLYGFGLVNLLADLYKNDIVSLTLGLKPGILYGSFAAEGARDGGVAPVVGGTGGIKLQLTDGFAIRPTLDVLVPISTNRGEALPPWFTGTVGLIF